LVNDLKDDSIKQVNEGKKMKISINRTKTSVSLNTNRLDKAEKIISEIEAKLMYYYIEKETQK
jgi:hypothetical protein